MSLINKVLKDLESRQRAPGDRPPSPMLEDLRAAPTPERRGWSARAYGWALGAVLVGVLLVAAGVEYGQRVGVSRAARTDLVGTAQSPVPAPRPALLTTAPSPPAVVIHGGAVSHGRAVPKVPASKKGRAPVVLSASAPAPRRPVPRKLPVAHSPAAFHFYGKGISKRAATMTPAEQSVARYRLAIAALQQGQAGMARRDLKAALAFVPGAARPALLLAGLDIRAGQLQAAQQVLAQGLASHPHRNSLIMLSAQVDLRLGQAAAALGVLARIPPRSQTEPYWALLAASRLRAGNGKAAVRAYQHGLKRFPQSGSLWVGLGLAESEGGHARAARLAFRRAQKCPLGPVLARFVRQQLKTLP